MFTIWNHFAGAITVRIHRFLLVLKNKPDAVLILPNLFVGGNSNIINLKKLAINSILDLTENQNNKRDAKNFSINYLGLPIPDRGIPSLADSFMATKWIQTQLDNNGTVFVHCDLGRGRGPLLIILYLISRGMTKDDAIKLTKNKRSYIFLNNKQLSLLSMFEKHMK